MYVETERVDVDDDDDDEDIDIVVVNGSFCCGWVRSSFQSIEAAGSTISETFHHNLHTSPLNGFYGEFSTEYDLYI